MLNVVKNTKISVLDLVAPHRCRGCGELGEVLCECCKNYNISNKVNICPKCGEIINYRCSKCVLPYLMTFCFGYRDEILGQMAEEFKFYGVRAIGKAIGELVDRMMPEIEGDIRIVPLPTIHRHIRERGVDHTYMVAKEVARRRGWKVERVLLRKNETVQIGKNKKERLAQAKEAYKRNPKVEIDSEATYIMLDDVWTTGASMTEAGKLIRKAGAVNLAAIILVKAGRPEEFKKIKPTEKIEF